MKKLLFVLVAAALLAAKDNPDVKKPKPRFPIGKETTYVTGPLDADGYIDYIAALNERLRRGVTPKNNSVVLLWKALGPHPEGATMPDEFFKWLEIESPPEKGDYFVPLSRFVTEQLKLKAGPDSNALSNELSRCSQRSWKASEHPNISAWLKANEKPLEVVIEASKRSHYYSPLTPKRPKKGPALFINALLPGVQKCRELVSALTARAMLRVREGRFEDAWQDLLACHRLSRLIARGGTTIELLVGIALDAVAAKADLAFLEHVDWKADKITACLHELRKLPPMPPAADKADLGERFMYLNIVQAIERYGPEVLEDGTGLAPAKEPGFWARLFRASVNWEPALRNANRWYDRIAAAMRIEDRPTREKELTQLNEDLMELDKRNRDSMPSPLTLLFAKDSDKLRGEAIGNVMICLMVPAFNKVQSANDRSEQMQSNLYLAFALAAYRRENGRYPKELAALAPKFLDKVPTDMFSGQPLIYRPDEKGYLLYSIGVNGKDEQGQSYEDQPQGDDLTVRMPPPKLK